MDYWSQTMEKKIDLDPLSHKENKNVIIFPCQHVQNCHYKKILACTKCFGPIHGLKVLE